MALTKKTKAKSNVWLIVLLLWTVLSAVYIMHDLWKNGLSATYLAGYQKAVSEVFASSQTCQPFEVFVGEARTQLISVACLQAAQQQAQAAQGEGTMMEKEEAVMEQ